MLSMFKDSDQEKANSNLNVYDFNMMQGATALLQGNFKIAAQHHRNIANALDNLQTLKNEKEMMSLAAELLKQIQREERRRGQRV